MDWIEARRLLNKDVGDFGVHPPRSGSDWWWVKLPGAGFRNSPRCPHCGGPCCKYAWVRCDTEEEARVYEAFWRLGLREWRYGRWQEPVRSCRRTGIKIGS